MEKTLILLKPDCIERGLAGEALRRFENAALRIVEARLARPSLEQLRRHYADLESRDERAFLRTTASLAGKAFLAVVLEGANAIRKGRLLTGPTEPLTAPCGTIRGDFGNDSLRDADAENRATRNLVHAADSKESVAREMSIWF